MTAPRRLSWVERASTSKAYPYEVIGTVRGYSVYAYGPQHYELLAHELSSRKLAKEFAERHYQREKESA